MPEKKEIAVKDTSVESLISQGIEKGITVEVMEKLFTLRTKVKAEQAKEEFVRALASFQSACPVIKKTKKVLNKDGSVRYMFAPLDTAVAQIKKPLGDNELSYTWDVKNEKVDNTNYVTAVAKLTHALGHSETSEFKVPVDVGGFMTEPQKYAAALTFAKRYSLFNVLGISTSDDDDDSLSVKKESDAKSIKSKIMLRLRTLKKPSKTKEDVEKSVKELTGLELKEVNYAEIVGRLDVIIDQTNESN
jgi:hypothetical protein